MKNANELIIIALVTFVFLTLAVAFAAAADVPPTQTTPVLVELFTSEGCSSCPPADLLLTKLDELQPVSGAQVIVLGEHVDYWNHDGWKDVYSSSFFTERQEDYERRLQQKSPYTPQMVVDGAMQLNGSNGRAALEAIEAARSRAKVAVRISSVSVENKTLRAHLEVEPLPEGFKTRKADVWVAVALDHAESHVGGGENKGRDLKHVAVAESIEKVGSVEKSANFDRDVVVKLTSGADLANLRVVGFVQESGGGPVLGASLVGPTH